METENIVRLLTIGSLAGLLAAVGMRLTVTQVVIALRRGGLGLVVTANFVVVPILVLAATKLCGFGSEITIGMILLAAAPFAPVVPVFARMARADLALAAGLTALFPLLSVILTPFVCEMMLTQVAHAASVRFNVSKALLVLLATIVVPLCLGLLVKHVSPLFVRRILRPVEIFSEGDRSGVARVRDGYAMANNSDRRLAAVAGDGDRERDLPVTGLCAGWTGARCTASHRVRHEQS